MSGRNPPSYCTLTLIAMQGHQQKGRQTNTSSTIKTNTIIETSTAEDHDDENLHNPSTRPRYSPGHLHHCCCCFSHSAHWLPTRKKLLYTVANPARGLLNRGKKNKKIWQRSPPPPRARAARSARIPTTRWLGQLVSLRKILRFRVRLQLSQSRCLSLPLLMSGRVFLFFPSRGHEPPPTLRDRLNPNLSL